MTIEEFEKRKKEHLMYALNPENQAGGFAIDFSGLDQIKLYHNALPELNFDEISLGSTLLGKSTKTPFFIAGMMAGHNGAFELNWKFAKACATRGWAFGVGSQRRLLQYDDSIDDWQKLRAEFPDLMIFSNIGISQLIVSSSVQICKLVEVLKAQALVVHANALQECLQKEGTPQFKGGLQKLKEVCQTIGVPVVLKETGCGFSQTTLSRLKEVGLSAIDVSGLGGTHWGRIEGARADNPCDLKALASKTFSNWGEPTTHIVINAKKILPRLEIWASGGVRSGLDAAKLIALGAQAVGYAQPALKAVLQSNEVLHLWMERQEFELRVALFCTGCGTPRELQQKEGVWTIIKT